MVNFILSNSFKGCRYILILSFWFSVTLSEMVIKESKVEPFSLILNNQRQIIENMNLLIDKMKDISSLDQKVVLLSNNLLASKEMLINKMQQNFLQLNEKIDKVSNVVTDLQSSRDTNVLNRGLITVDDFLNFTEAVNAELRSKRFICNASYDEAFSEIPTISVPTAVPIKASTQYVIVNQSEIYDDGEAMNYFKEESTKPEPTSQERNILDLKSFIHQKMNATHDQHFRILSLLHNIEYRQHISSVSQDRRLNTLLHKIVVHENILENRLIENLKNEFKSSIDSIKNKIEPENQLSKDQFKSSLKVLEPHYNKTQPDELNSTLLQEADLKCHINDSECIPDSAEDLTTTETTFSPEEDVYFPSTFFPTTSEGAVEDPTLRPTTSLPQAEVSTAELEDYSLAPSVVKFPDYSVLFPNNIISTDDHDDDDALSLPSNDASSPRGGMLNDEETSEDKKSLHSQVADSELLKQTLKYISKSLKNQMDEIETLLSRRLNAAEDKLTGIRIHQASSFYSHSKEVRFEIEKMERVITDTVRATGAKLSKKLDGARKALFTFVDAAVTSVSSAAVTSAQSTGLQVARQLRQAVQDIAVKISGSNLPQSRQTCPEMYQKVGSTCLLALPDVSTTWSDGCKICQTVGGKFLKKDDDYSRIIKAIKHFGFSEIWLSDNDRDASDCDAYADVDYNDELSNSVHHGIVYHRQKEIEDCPALLADTIETKLTACSKKLGVLCQYTKCSSENTGKLAVNSSRFIDYFD